MIVVIEQSVNDYLLAGSENKQYENGSLLQLEQAIIFSSRCIRNCALHYDPTSLQMMSTFSPGVIRTINGFGFHC